VDVGESGQELTSELVASAAESSASETAQAIERAAAMNSDPGVADELEEASLQADMTVTRVGWLRRTISRLFGHQR
jgi:hypothetical protein